MHSLIRKLFGQRRQRRRSNYDRALLRACYSCFIAWGERNGWLPDQLADFYCAPDEADYERWLEDHRRRNNYLLAEGYRRPGK